jgi:DNA-binding transcriptional LysR family regulator
MGEQRDVNSFAPKSSIIELRHLRCFKAIVAVMHFTRASAQLHVGEPALSRTIKQLEEELGYPLFERDSRSVRLTNAGIFFAEQVDRILDQFDKALELTWRVAFRDDGSLKIGITQDMEGGALWDIILRFRQDHPEFQLFYYDCALSELVEMVDADKIDVVFHCQIPERVGRGRGLLHPEPLYVALPAVHPLAKEPVVSLEMLQNEVFLVSASSITSLELAQYMSLFSDTHVSPNFMTVTSFSSALSLISVGGGVTITYGPARRELEGVTYVPLPPSYQAQLTGYWKPHNPNPALSLFLRYFESV